MISAEVARESAKKNYLKIHENTHKEWFAKFYSLLQAAVLKGETQITNVLIDHKIKVNMVAFLEHHGYAVKEQKLGNTFTISWAATSKK